MKCKILFSMKKKSKCRLLNFLTQHAKVLKYRKHFLGDLHNFVSLRLNMCSIWSGSTLFTTHLAAFKIICQQQLSKYGSSRAGPRRSEDGGGALTAESMYRAA